jgi:Ni/Co efflux regulator RcnB
MKKPLFYVSLALLLAPDIALAQDNRPQPGAIRPTRPQAGDSGVTRPSRPSTRPAPNRPGAGGPQIQPPRPNPGRPGAGGPQIQPPRPNPSIRPPRPDRPQPPRPGRPGQSHRPGAGRPPHFKPIHGPQFRYPRGYAYRRWTIGLLLPTLFFSSTYYYDHYWNLGVGAPPPGYRWVRYGPDLLLVDIRTRRIADVIQGAFY